MGLKSKGDLGLKRIILLIIIFSIIIIAPTTVYGFKTFENQQVTIRSVTYKTNSLIAVEDGSCVNINANIFGCFLQPTIANELMGYSARTVSGVELPYEITLNSIDEQKAQFSLAYQVNSPLDPRIIINGSQLARVELNGASVPLGGTLWIYNSAQQFNRIELFQGVNRASTLTVFFQQNNYTDFATQGRLLEGNYISTLSDQRIEKFFNLIEFWNPDTNKLDKLIDKLKTDKEKIYHLILRVLLDKFEDNPQKIKDALRFLIDHYRNDNNMDIFFNNLEQRIRANFPDEV